MKPIRTLVVDDEPLARLRIVSLLKRVAYVQLLGEAKNGREAIQLIQEYRPDLVFLDIQMPDLSGIEVLTRDPAAKLPFIIFVTAFDQYAIKAFDLKAVDYLLKPFDDERFHQALAHARQQIELRDQAQLQQQIRHLLDRHAHQHEAEPYTIAVKHKGHTHYLPAHHLYYIEADGNYLHLILEKQTYLLRETLTQLEEQLPKDCFLRIHRSLLLNTQHLQVVKYIGNNQYQFQFPKHPPLLSGRTYVEAIRDWERLWQK